MSVREVSLWIPPEPRMELAATALAEVLGEGMCLSRDKIDEIKLAVVEACINAFEHSGRADRRIELVFRVFNGAQGREMLEVTVADQGKGFDPAKVEPPQIEKKLKGASKRGWGLAIINNLTDEMEIRSGDGGTIIVMRKYK